jgi:hypothetical protein
MAKDDDVIQGAVPTNVPTFTGLAPAGSSEGSLGTTQHPDTSDAKDIVQNADEEYIVEKVIKGRYLPDGSVEYLIHWQGYSKEDRTWEPEQNLNQHLRSYLVQNPVQMLGLKYKKSS